MGNIGRMTVRRLLASSVAAAVVGGAALAPAADAARVTRPFDIYTSATKTEGRAHVYGTVTFLDNGGVRVKGKINDNCPEDGYGAYVYFSGNRVGTDDLWQGGFKDLRGCKKADAVPFSFRTKRRSTNRINEVLIKLKEKDRNTRMLGDENTFLVTRR